CARIAPFITTPSRPYFDVW
nr:immunoglobulin heavy chain junction region [Mus musculus]